MLILSLFSEKWGFSSVGIERLPYMQRVGSSNLSAPTYFWECGTVVNCSGL